MSEIDKAIADARRGHRITEWEGVALRLADAAEQMLDTPEGRSKLRDGILSSMQAEVIAWAITKGWHGPDAPEVRFGEAMALLHSEVSEALEAYRIHGTDDFSREACQQCHCYEERDHWACDPHQCKPEGVGSEFADILIRLLHYSELFGVDLAAEYERKMAYNHTRAFRHGGRAL